MKKHALIKKTKAAALVEYAVLVGLIGIVAISAVLSLGERTRDVFDLTTTTLSTQLAPPTQSAPPRYDENDPITYLIPDPGGSGILIFSPTGPADADPGEVVLRCAMPGMTYQPWGEYEVPGIIETANNLTSRPDNIGPSRTDTIGVPNLTEQNWYGEYLLLHPNGFHYWGITARIPVTSLRQPGQDGCVPW